MTRRLLLIVALGSLGACDPAPAPAAAKPPDVPAASPAAPDPTEVLEPAPSNAPPPILEQDPLVVRIAPNKEEPVQRQVFVLGSPGVEMWSPFLWEESDQGNHGAVQSVVELRPRSVELRAEGDVTTKELDLFVRQLTAKGVVKIKVVLAPTTPAPETEPPAVLKARADAARPKEVLKELENPVPLGGPLPSNLVDSMKHATEREVPSLGSPEMVAPAPQK